MELLNTFHGNIVDDVELYRMAFQAVHKSLRRHQLYKGGTIELLNKPEFQDVDKAKSIFSMLEERDAVIDLLYDENSTGQSVTVRIGEETRLAPISDCSIIEATFKANDMVLGKVAVLGPTRMEYAKIIGLLDFMKEHVTSILEHYHKER